MLRRGELTVLGRIRSASNATFLCEATLGEHSVHCVYKPIAGEQPLWDFPDGTLAGRELRRLSGVGAAGLEHRALHHHSARAGRAGHAAAVGGPARRRAWTPTPGPGPDLVDLVPAGSCPPGYLPVLRPTTTPATRST